MQCHKWDRNQNKTFIKKSDILGNIASNYIRMLKNTHVCMPHLKLQSIQPGNRGRQWILSMIFHDHSSPWSAFVIWRYCRYHWWWCICICAIMWACNVFTNTTSMVEGQARTLEVWGRGHSEKKPSLSFSYKSDVNQTCNLQVVSETWIKKGWKREPNLLFLAYLIGLVCYFIMVRLMFLITTCVSMTLKFICCDFWPKT